MKIVGTTGKFSHGTSYYEVLLNDDCLIEKIDNPNTKDDCFIDASTLFSNLISFAGIHAYSILQQLNNKIPESYQYNQVLQKFVGVNSIISVSLLLSTILFILHHVNYIWIIE